VYATYERRWWTLTVLCLSLVLVVMANAVLNVGLPVIQRELGATATELQWIVDAYALVFAGLLLTAGALGDRFGRKGALTTGLVIFGVVSLGGTFATSPAQLIAVRALLGLAAALIMPGTLSILANVFPVEERGKAIAVWAVTAGSASSVGPVSGGWLVGRFSWHAPFWLNVVVVVVALVLGALLVPTSRDPERSPLDPAGAILSMAGLSALLYAVIEAPNHGWLDRHTLVSFALAGGLLAVFAVVERKLTRPMLELRFFRNPSFSAASGALFTVFLGLFGAMFLAVQYLQFVRGYSAFHAGLSMLPMTLPSMVVAPFSPRLVARHGPRSVISAGLVVAAVGLVPLSLNGLHTSFLLIMLPLIVMGLGIGLIMAPATTSIMTSLPLGRAGVGSAVNDTTRELGGALGVAVLGSVAVSRYAESLGDALRPLPPGVRAVARRGIGGALQAADAVGGRAGAQLAAAAKQAFIEGFRLAGLVSAAVFLVGAAAAWRFLPTGTRVPAPSAPSAPPVPVAEGVEVGG
jgi:EmrB/QacA subfamily drug resistance transporter